jgi:hypothetical protein
VNCRRISSSIVWVLQGIQEILSHFAGRSAKATTNQFYSEDREISLTWQFDGCSLQSAFINEGVRGETIACNSKVRFCRATSCTQTLKAQHDPRSITNL